MSALNRPLFHIRKGGMLTPQINSKKIWYQLYVFTWCQRNIFHQKSTCYSKPLFGIRVFHEQKMKIKLKSLEARSNTSIPNRHQINTKRTAFAYLKIRIIYGITLHRVRKDGKRSEYFMLLNFKTKTEDNNSSIHDLWINFCQQKPYYANPNNYSRQHTCNVGIEEDENCGRWKP